MTDIAKRLEEYAQDYYPALSAGEAERLESYALAVLEENERMNLTAITERDAFVDKHLLDSLAAAGLGEMEGEVCDVGSGAGLPGAVIAAVKGGARVTLIEATAKKLEFAKRTCAALGIPVTALHARSEELARNKKYRDHYDCAVARAVAPLPTLCELCLPLVRVGGHFVAMKGPDAAAELASAESALRRLGGELAYNKEYALPDGSRRSLLVIKKLYPTPEKYPRAGGRIAKKPL